ncbi:hypothetical protein ACQR1I_21840 [Bradyrhizobium sp. HKCCYLS2038]|uniref:hypothetical protein n=1 Tax=unclassified Bradyrhizobium TaxID=2631580 RepID=UPI003EBA9AE9
MRVDHVLPRSLINQPERLSTILAEYGLPRNFEIESFENWLPACEPCNVAKGDRVFQAALIVLVHLERARSNAAKTEAAANRVIQNQAISKALNTLERALDARQIDLSILDPLIRDYRQSANQSGVAEFRISPGQTVIYEGDSYQILRGQYGVGYRPSREDVDSSFQCPHCGTYGPWSGARCLGCGHLIELD